MLEANLRMYVEFVELQMISNSSQLMSTCGSG